MTVKLRVGRIAIPDTPRGRMRETPPPTHPPPLRAPARPRLHGPPAPRHVDARARAAPPDRAPSSTPARCSSLPSAHTAETDFGALNVKSIPPARRPSAPARRMNSPVTGCRPSINATSCSALTGSPASRPSRSRVSSSTCQIARRLRRLARRREVVVAARRGDRPRLQIRAVARRLSQHQCSQPSSSTPKSYHPKLSRSATVHLVCLLFCASAGLFRRRMPPVTCVLVRWTATRLEGGAEWAGMVTTGCVRQRWLLRMVHSERQAAIS